MAGHVHVATPHGGLHLYFRVPSGAAAASAIGRWPGIDIRAPGCRSGGYLAAPGSVVDGVEYVIEHDFTDLGPARVAGPAARPGRQSHPQDDCSPPPLAATAVPIVEPPRPARPLIPARFFLALLVPVFADIEAVTEEGTDIW